MNSRLFSLILVPFMLSAIGCGGKFESAKIKKNRSTTSGRTKTTIPAAQPGQDPTVEGDAAGTAEGADKAVLEVGSNEQMSKFILGIELQKSAEGILNVRLLVQRSATQVLDLLAQVELTDIEGNDEARTILIDSSLLAGQDVATNQAFSRGQMDTGIVASLRYNKAKTVFDLTVDTTEEASRQVGYIVNAIYSFAVNAQSGAIEMSASSLGGEAVAYDQALNRAKQSVQVALQSAQVMTEIQTQEQQKPADADQQTQDAATTDTADAAAGTSDAPDASDTSDKTVTNTQDQQPQDQAAAPTDAELDALAD